MPPATEETKRNQQTLHVWFGLTSLLMLVSTIWMLSKDHARPWKDFQRTAQELDRWNLQGQIDQERVLLEQTELASQEDAIGAARSAAVDPDRVSEFVKATQQEQQRVTEENEQRAAENKAPWDEAVALEMSDFEALLDELPDKVTAAADARSAYEQANSGVRDAVAAAHQAPGDEAAVATAKEAIRVAEEAEATLREAESQAAEIRDGIVGPLSAAVGKAKFREDNLAQAVKFAKADLTAITSQRDIAVGLERPHAELQQSVDETKALVDDLTLEMQAANQHRLGLQQVVAELNSAEDEARKQLADTQSVLERLRQQSEDSREDFWKMRWILRLPVLDAFDNSDLAIDNGWLPDMPINYNFSDVARFDRCATCHTNIAKTAAGTASTPRYEHEQSPQEMSLATPSTPPAAQLNREGELEQPSVLDVYGMEISTGPLARDDVSVRTVIPESSAAVAGLEQGDVIESIDGANVLTPEAALAALMGEKVAWGEPLELRVRRGVPHPYASHPRLDLYMTDLSPHPKGTFGCTICHDGQGSGTEFKWASHMPNNMDQQEEWQRAHGWFDNHHWIFPMLPQRFLESNCLKCHHDVVELEPSEQFPEPPAPKLVRGHALLLQKGCFGCHEINGYDGPDKRIGPDLRAEPNYSAVASQLAFLMDKSARTPAPANDQSNQAELAWAERLITHPEDHAVRHRLFEVIVADQQRANSCQETARQLLRQTDLTEEQRGWAEQLRTQPHDSAALRALSESLLAETSADTGPSRLEATRALANQLEAEESRFSLAIHKLADGLKDVESPGTLRKTGPSLRRIASKVDFAFLYDWINNPRHFRPDTNMPRFFGQHHHLEGESLAVAQRYEPVEVRAMAEYLGEYSQPFNYLSPPEGVAPADAERGRATFETRGCLACHSHSGFPGIAEDQGPNLSALAAKFGSDNSRGRDWLYTWIREPSRYHPRTKMPNPLLETYTTAEGQLVDPALDIVAYLTTFVPTSEEPAWQRPQVSRQLTSEQQTALYDLALEHLASAMKSTRMAEHYLEHGIPAEMAGQLQGDEIALVRTATDENQDDMTDENRVDMWTEYVGRRSISKYGCSGCHDIPGFETAKPIGTGLADWGRKDPSKLAFEQILLFLGGHGHGDDGHAHGDATEHAEAHGEPGAVHEVSAESEGHHATEAHTVDHSHAVPAGHGLSKADLRNPDVKFYLNAIDHHNRQGFIWQKLRQPRSYDYEKTENKSFNEWLRMPQFELTADEREAIITFVLGLVSEPAPAEFIYQPGPRQQAINEGRVVINKYNCAGCHQLRLDRWELAYHADDFDEPASPADFPFLDTHFTPEQIEESLQTNLQGQRTVVLHGQPERSEETGQVLKVDEDLIEWEPNDEGLEPFHNFVLWQPTLINGQVNRVGTTLTIRAREQGHGPLHGKVYPAWGGALANYLYPRVIADAQAANPNVKGSEAWGWLPPSLAGEGLKVQTSWLHEFMLNPYRIRPAAVLRMPKFNLSSDEATKIANFFAAVDDASYPYEFDLERGREFAADLNDTQRDVMTEARNIVVNNTYCVKCHYVADFAPSGEVTAHGPNLADAYQRLRPEYLRRWIANPLRILPYTGMPVNIPFQPTPPHYGGVAQDIFRGTSLEQLDGVVNFLSHFDVYARRQLSFRELVEQQAPAQDPNQPSGNDQAGSQETEAAASSDDLSANQPAGSSAVATELGR